jgi:uncharacterized protein YdeI (YjbR/CyaY-like superfamily)
LGEIEPASRAEWRRWLAEHHGTSPGIWLIWRKKRGGAQPLTLEEAVLEALCFGWIDSRLRPLDDEKSALMFTPRKPCSTWSRLNKERVESLIAAGLMTDAGRRVIDAAQQDGSWSALDAIEELRVPDDLEQALAANPDARRNFDAFTPSAKKNALWWIKSAKRPQTRARRVAETVRLAAQKCHRDQPPPEPPGVSGGSSDRDRESQTEGSVMGTYGYAVLSACSMQVKAIMWPSPRSMVRRLRGIALARCSAWCGGTRSS